MTQAVLFDFGGVFTVSPFETIHAATAEMGVDPDVTLNIVFGRYDRDTDHPWHRLERGEMTMEDYGTEVRGELAAVGIDMDPFDVLRRVGSGGIIRDDVVDHVRRVREAGGAVHEGPTHLRGRGTYAIVRDPFGAELVLLRADGGDPPDTDRDDRVFLWTELWAERPSEAVEFYAELTGCKSLPVKGAGYWVLYSETSWRFGITHLPTLKTSPQWVPSVRVADLEEVLSRVEALGGKVLVKPTDRLSDGTSALIADPEGALLMIEIWRAAKRGS